MTDINDINSKFNECDAIFAKLVDNSYKELLVQVQDILKKNVNLISEIEELKSDNQTPEQASRTAILIQELNSNLNEVVRIYQDVGKTNK